MLKTQKEIEEKLQQLPQLYKASKGDIKYISYFLHSLRAADKEVVMKEIEKVRESHTHNSIPSFEADLNEGCNICFKNHVLSDLLTYLKDNWIV